MIDLTQARAFLEALGGDDFVFQTFTDNKEKKTRKKYDPLAKVLLGTFEDHHRQLAQLSKEGAGIFVQINEGGRGKDEVTKIRSVFVDLDSPATSKESLDAIKKHMPVPTIITQTSKGKYHLYWAVDDCPVASFKRFQQSLAIKFYSDLSVKNLDRVMRLPGFPHQKYIPHAVTCITPNKKYKAKQIQQAAAKAPTLTPVSIESSASGTAKDVFGLNMGSGYEEPTVLAPGDRTQKMISHIGSLTSQGYSAAYIRKEILRMNKDLCPDGSTPIPMSLLETEILPCIDKFVDKRSDEERRRDEDFVMKKRVAACDRTKEFKKREAAKEEVPDCPDLTPEEEEVEEVEQEEEEQTLDDWLDRFLLIERGSRVVDQSKKGDDAVYSLDDFKNAKSNVWVGNNALLSKKWLGSKERQSVRDIVYKPKDDKIIKHNNERKYNSYSPSSLKPSEHVDSTKIAVFKQHLEFLFPKTIHRKVFMDWFVMTVQKPEIRIPWAPLLISEPGAGKGFLYEVLEALLGPHNCQKVIPDRLESQFNSFMYKTTLVCFDEMYFKEKVSVGNKLKHYVTEKTIEINSKGVPEGQRDIYCNMIIFTNSENSTHIEDKDRRFWVYKIKGIPTLKEFDMLWSWVNDQENLSNLLRWCLDYDISAFKCFAHPPMTESKAAMIFANKSEIEVELRDAIENHEGPFGADIVAYHAAKEYLSLQYNFPITGRSEGVLRQLWGSVAKKLPQAPDALRSSLNSERHRVSCVRNFDYWCEQPLVDIRYELTRSIQFMTSKTKVLPAKLREVKGDEN